MNRFQQVHDDAKVETARKWAELHELPPRDYWFDNRTVTTMQRPTEDAALDNIYYELVYGSKTFALSAIEQRVMVLEAEFRKSKRWNTSDNMRYEWIAQRLSGEITGVLHVKGVLAQIDKLTQANEFASLRRESSNKVLQFGTAEDEDAA